MKKTLFLLLTVSLIFSLTGCRINDSSLSDLEIKEKLAAEIKEAISIEVKNVKILVVKDFHDRKMALITYDLLSDHHVSYRLFEVKENEVELHGGGDGIAAAPDVVPLTFSVGSGIDCNNEYYVIAYGEAYDNNIKKVKVTYGDNTSIMEPVTNGGYLIITEGKGDINKAVSIEGLDEELKTIYKFP